MAAASGSGGGGAAGGSLPYSTPRSMDTHMGEVASARITAPSAERNKQFILDELLKVLPDAEAVNQVQGGRVLEIASGTGQHISHFAAATPWLTWTPTELTDETFDSVKAW